MSRRGQLYPWTRVRAQQMLQAADRLPHALLLAGPRGLGKADFAAHMAQMFSCERPDQAALTPCGNCQNCRLLAAGNHPDVRWVEPLEEGKAILIDQIRELADFLQLRPHIGRRKIVIISPAEAMNINAANSLLKLLEEPPADSVLFLASSDATRLPATVRSRCHRLAFAIPGRQEALDWLQATAGFSTEQAQSLLNLGGGAPLRAQALGQEDFLTLRNELLDDVENLSVQRADPLACAARWKGHGARRCLDWLQGSVTDLIRISVAPPGEGAVNGDQRERLHVLQKRLDSKQLFRFLETISESRNLAGGPLDEQLLLEDILIRWTRLAQRT